MIYVENFLVKKSNIPEVNEINLSLRMCVVRPINEGIGDIALLRVLLGVWSPFKHTESKKGYSQIFPEC